MENIAPAAQSASFCLGRLCSLAAANGAAGFAELMSLYLQDQHSCYCRALMLLFTAADRAGADHELQGLCRHIGLVPAAAGDDAASFAAGFFSAPVPEGGVVTPAAVQPPALADIPLAAAASKADEVGFSRQTSGGGREMKPRDSALEEYTGKPALRPVTLKWFDGGNFLARVAELVNQYFGTRWLAFSLSGIAYVQTTTIYDIIIAMGVEAKVPNMRETYSDDRQKVILVKSALSQCGAVAVEMLEEGAFCRYFDVEMKGGSSYRRCSFVPIKMELLPVKPELLEKRKVGKISGIVAVRPRND